MRALRFYIELLRPRPVRAVFLASVIGRLPSGMMSVALLLLLEHRTDSYGVAGIAVASYNFSFSMVAPLMGRLVDRADPRRVLMAGGVAQLTAIAVLLAVVHVSSVPWQLVLVSILVGISPPPPITACMRALWPRLVGSAQRASAYSLEAALTEVVFIGGPLIVGALTALASPAVALAAAGALGATGALAMALAHPPVERVAGQRVARHWAGPLAHPPFRVLVPVTVCSAAALGLLEIAVIAEATDAGVPALAGVLLGVVACGSLAGGLWYGGRTWSADAGRQYGWVLAAFALCLVPLVFASDIAALAALLAIAGMMIAPVGTVQGQLVAALAPSNVRTEAFTWINTGNFAGFSLGMAFGGTLIELGGSASSFAAAAAAAAIAAVLAARARALASHAVVTPA